jgi:hypothetical protein
MRLVLTALTIVFCAFFTQLEAQSIMQDNGATTSIVFDGDYVDYQIPSTTTATRIEFNLKGADGGKHNGCSRRGGEGATVLAGFVIGTGINELQPGGYIRIIVGGKGDSFGSQNDGGAGGGGGTGILYTTDRSNTEATPNFSGQNDKWVILAVAGGGGGVSINRTQTGCFDGDNGNGGNTGTSGTSGGNDNSGGTNGNGGIRTGPNNSGAGGAGGGYLSDGAASSNLSIDGRKGGVTGGVGGASVGTFIRAGGFGYGGGGSASSTLDDGGGGGGGYSGGGSGSERSDGQGGGGGGSFINSASLGQFNSIVGLETTNSPEDGWANFAFRSAGGTEIACRTTGDIRISGDNTRVFGSQVTSYRRVGIGETITDFGFVIAGQIERFIELDCSDVGSSLSNLMIVTSSSGPIAFCNINVEIKSVAPVLTCLRPFMVFLNGNGTANILASSVQTTLTVGCGEIVSQVVSPSVVDCGDLNVAIPATLTVTDNYGNTDACTVMVTATDLALPTARCQDVVLELEANPTDLDPILVDNGSSDNCGIASYVLSQSSFTTANIGENTVTLTVRDASGNPRNCNAIVTVEDRILPVSWRYFTAERSAGKSVLLKWGTAQEMNNAGFTIQRSTDGESWRGIGFKAASSATVPTYIFEDEEAPAATLYYRLRQEDHDGAFAFSAIRQIQQTELKETVYPNPFAEAVTLFSDVAQEVTIYDLQGRVVSTIFHAGNGAQATALDLKAGLYQVYFQRSGTVLRLVSMR